MPVVARVGTDRRLAGERFSDMHIDRHMPEMPECVLNVHIYVRHLPEKNLGVPETLSAPSANSILFSSSLVLGLERLTKCLKPVRRPKADPIIISSSFVTRGKMPEAF